MLLDGQIVFVCTKHTFHAPECFRLKRAKTTSVIPLVHIQKHIMPCRNCLTEMAKARYKAESQGALAYQNWLDGVLERASHAA